jgi:RNA polymerase sigma-70 factor (sigma-E family)
VVVTAPRDTAAADFSAFAASCQHRMLRVAYLICGDRFLAEDLLQDALVKLALRWSRLADGHPEAYLRTVLYRDAVSHWRSRRREVVTDAPVDVTVNLASGDRVEDKLLFAAALGKLTRKQRAVLVLRFYEDMSEARTAEVLGVRVGTVKSQTSVALARLRELAPELASAFAVRAGEEKR